MGAYSWQGDLLWVSRTLKDTTRGHLTIDRHSLAVAGGELSVTGLSISRRPARLETAWVQYHWVSDPAHALNLQRFVFGSWVKQPVSSSTRLESYRFLTQLTACGFGFVPVSEEGLCSLSALCCSPVQVVCRVIRGSPVVGGASPGW